MGLIPCIPCAIYFFSGHSQERTWPQFTVGAIREQPRVLQEVRQSHVLWPPMVRTGGLRLSSSSFFLVNACQGIRAPCVFGIKMISKCSVLCSSFQLPRKDWSGVHPSFLRQECIQGGGEQAQKLRKEGKLYGKTETILQKCNSNINIWARLGKCTLCTVRTPQRSRLSR